MKALCLVDNDEQLKDISNRVDELERHTKERYAFLEKQGDQVKKEYISQNNELKKSLVDFAKARKFIPEDHAETSKSHLHLGAGVLYLCDGDHGMDPTDVLKALFRS